MVHLTPVAMVSRQGNRTVKKTQENPPLEVKKKKGPVARGGSPVTQCDRGSKGKVPYVVASGNRTGKPTLGNLNRGRLLTRIRYKGGEKKEKSPKETVERTNFDLYTGMSTENSALHGWKKTSSDG